MLGLDRLEKIVDGRTDFHVVKKDSEGKNIEVTFQLNPSASYNEIVYMEQSIGKILPKEYKEFLLLYNGARLYDYEGIDGFQLLSCSEIVKANSLAKATFEEDWNDYLIIFAKYIGESNYLAFNISDDNQNVIDCYFEELPSDWVSIAKNFNEFLLSLFEFSGNKYWLK